MTPAAPEHCGHECVCWLHPTNYTKACDADACEHDTRRSRPAPQPDELAVYREIQEWGERFGRDAIPGFVDARISGLLLAQQESKQEKEG